jgi:hypothetical protein
MDDNDARAMRDKHALDEAALRSQQQRQAGDSHAPVESYPQHGAQSPGSAEPDALVRRYEDALDEERAAWQRVKAAGDASDFASSWEQWRASVERRDEATRLLINKSLSGLSL